MKKPDIRTYSNNTELISERREHIARCAAPLLLKQGYDRTSIRDIAKACGMSMGHLYYYIGSKEDIFQIVIDYDDRFFTNVEQVATSYNTLTPTEALIKVIDRYFRGMVEANKFARFYYQEMRNLQPELRERIFQREIKFIAEFEKLLRKGSKTGEFKITNIKVVANNIIILGHMWVLRRLFLDKGYTLDKYIRSQTENILKSISAAYPPEKSGSAILQKPDHPK